ncbi:hypothetical protein vseg_019735 [Gypsophila vaccaria]
MVYAFNGIMERNPLWLDLRRITQSISWPWTVAGDFNCVLSVTERVGGYVATAEMEPFRDCVDDYDLIDINSAGAVYTWNNKQKLEDRIYSKLDRFLINKQWSDLFPGALPYFLPECTYDHSPCVVSQYTYEKHAARLKYINMWGSSERFRPIIRQTWDHSIAGTNMYWLACNLKQLKHGLRELNKERYSDIEQRTSVLETQVKQLQTALGQNPLQMHLIEEEHTALKELKEMRAARDAFLSQKLKGMWLREGDSNTSYFHGLIRSRCNKN